MPIRKRVDVDPLKAFRNHGFRVSPNLGNESQAVGNCVFCGKEGHFYINRETKQWDCKRCGKAGGFQTWLKEIVDYNKNLPTIIDRLKELSLDRGISVDTFLAYDVGFNLETAEYTIPVYRKDGAEETVCNIYRYKIGEKDFRGTAACDAAILNWDLANNFVQLWACEGFWDAMALHENLFKLDKDSKELPLGMPGASMFKPEWLSIFQDKKIGVLYDADEAGRTGELKAYNMLKRCTSDLSFLHWDKSVKDGYDFRDLYIDESTIAYDYIVARMNEFPQGVDTSALNITSNARVYDGTGLTADTVYKHFQKWLYMPDTSLVDVVFGTVIANRQNSDSVWTLLVAPPGATKTSMLESLLEAPDIVYKNQLGAKSLVSGTINAGGADPSLLPKLHQRMLVIEDLTTLMSMPSIYLEEILGILRAAFNGRYERDYGNGRIFRCDCKFGILAGVTPAIEHMMEGHTAVGERFLSYYLPIPRDIKGRRPYLQKARENRGKEKEMKMDLKRISRQALNFSFTDAPNISYEFEDKIMDLAQITSMVRGTVRRERYSSKKEVTNEPYSELGTRLTTQFFGLIDGIGRFRRVSKVGKHEYNIVRKIACGSCPNDRRRFLETMHTDLSREWSTTEISEASGLPRYPLCDRIAETLYLLGILKRTKAIEGLRAASSWVVEPEFAELTEGTGIFK